LTGLTKKFGGMSAEWGAMFKKLFTLIIANRMDTKK
jgi:hypothetical protein